MKVYELPWPPSINHYYDVVKGKTVSHKRILKPATRKYHDDAYLYVVAQKKGEKTLEGALEAIVYVYPPDNRRRDDDNIQKAIWDVLQKAGIYKDDSQIKRKHTYWASLVKGGLVKVGLIAIENELIIPDEFKIVG